MIHFILNNLGTVWCAAMGMFVGCFMARVHDLKVKVTDYHGRWTRACTLIDELKEEHSQERDSLTLEICALQGLFDDKEIKRRKLQAQKAFEEGVRMRHLDLSVEAVKERTRRKAYGY